MNANNPKVPRSSSPTPTRAAALEQLVEDIGGKGDIGYVYVAGFAPLDRRNEVFEEVLAANPGLENVAHVRHGLRLHRRRGPDPGPAVLTANPDITAMFAPYDEFAKGAVLAVEAAGSRTR